MSILKVNIADLRRYLDLKTKQDVNDWASFLIDNDIVEIYGNPKDLLKAIIGLYDDLIDDPVNRAHISYAMYKVDVRNYDRQYGWLLQRSRSEFHTKRQRQLRKLPFDRIDVNGVRPVREFFADTIVSFYIRPSDVTPTKL